MTVTERFARWMADTAGIDGARLGPRLAGGNANVTRLVEAEDARFIVRHPPAAALSAKAAAGIEREARLLAAIADTGRAPALIGVCVDPAVLGAPFAVQQFVPGTAITTKLPAAYADDGETVSEIGRELVRAIADVHRVDPARLGTPRPQSASFLARQIARWREARRKDGVRDLPLFEQLGAWLASTMPKVSASSGVTRLRGMGRLAVRCMRPSMSASYHMLRAPDAPAPTAMQISAASAKTGCMSPGAAIRPTSAVNTTSDITRGFISAK